MHQKTIAVGLLLLMLAVVVTLVLPHKATAQQIKIARIATDLRNPRGVAVFPDGRLLVAEAGDGKGERESGGYIRVFSDLNTDGDYDDSDERLMVTCCIAGYNTLTH